MLLYEILLLLRICILAGLLLSNSAKILNFSEVQTQSFNGTRMHTSNHFSYNIRKYRGCSEEDIQFLVLFIWFFLLDTFIAFFSFFFLPFLIKWRLMCFSPPSSTWKLVVAVGLIKHLKDKMNSLNNNYI